MPNCSTCEHHDNCSRNNSADVTRLRKCTCAILSTFIDKCRGLFTEEHKGRVLEVGFGASRHTRNIINDTGTLEWYGIDPAWNDHPDRNIFCDSVGSTRFPDKFFDIVIASNSMEHWHVFEEDYGKCLNEIHRVLKSDGKFLCLVPMRSHGGRIFRMDRIGKVERMFKSWRITSFTSWKNDIDANDIEYMFEIEAVK